MFAVSERLSDVFLFAGKTSICLGNALQKKILHELLKK